MPNKYVVEWAKHYYACGEVKVEADSSEEAEELVREHIGDYEGHMEYEPDKDFVSVQLEIPEQERIPEYFRKLVLKAPLDDAENIDGKKFVLVSDFHELLPIEANARLINKAPELLKILEGFLATLDADDPEEEAVARSHYNTHIGLWNAAINAHQAITGEEVTP